MPQNNAFAAVDLPPTIAAACVLLRARARLCCTRGPRIQSPNIPRPSVTLGLRNFFFFFCTSVFLRQLYSARVIMYWVLAHRGALLRFRSPRRKIQITKIGRKEKLRLVWISPPPQPPFDLLDRFYLQGYGGENKTLKIITPRPRFAHLEIKICLKTIVMCVINSWWAGLRQPVLSPFIQTWEVNCTPK